MRKVVSSLLFFLMFLPTPCALAEEYYTPLNLFFNVYSNGVTEVVYVLETDPTMVTIEIPLFGKQIDNLVIQDDEGLFLDSSPTPSGISVDTLGSTDINITYRTSSLTAKSELIWTFNVSAPILSTIRLPLGAIIFDISDIPTDLRTVEGRQYVTMNAGEISLFYIINLPDIMEEAVAELRDAESYIAQVGAQGIIVVEAEALLEQAQDAFESDQYLESKQLATFARARAETISEKASLASEMIESAENALEEARDDGRTLGLSEVEVRLQTAKDYYSEGLYTEAFNLASQVYQEAGDTEKPRGTNTLLYAGVVVIATTAMSVYYLYSKGRLKFPTGLEKEVERPSHEVRVIDLEKIFRENTSLRLDEREVIRFIAERGGEAFANEVRERFDIPRSSAWRLLRRMTNEGILVEEKVENKSFYKINEKYRI
ncbi:MAG: hypothetical protein JSV27_03660 [Candidatus Bathyarchaeota archaeon]|nr:MAG: hypothetical protein JSV27_03660 [Candidatus Bathyarchaeota archaeon]